MNKKASKKKWLWLAAIPLAVALFGDAESTENNGSPLNETVIASVGGIPDDIVPPEEFFIDNALGDFAPDNSTEEEIPEYNTIEEVQERVESACNSYNVSSIRVLEGTLTYDVISATEVELFYEIDDPIPIDQEYLVDDVNDQIIDRIHNAIDAEGFPEFVDVNVTSTYYLLEEDPEPVEPVGTDYVLNTNTGKFHYTWCSSVDQMKNSNKRFYTGTREEVIAMGYDSCGRCHP